MENNITRNELGVSIQIKQLISLVTREIYKEKHEERICGEDYLKLKHNKDN